MARELHVQLLARDQRRHSGGVRGWQWGILENGKRRIGGLHDKQGDAVSASCELAQVNDFVVVHRRDGVERARFQPLRPCECGCGELVARRKDGWETQRFVKGHNGRVFNERAFWARVSKRKKKDGCWLWTGHASNGYGAVTVRGSTIPAARMAYELKVGPVPDDWKMYRRCGERMCVNPAHCVPLTNGELRRVFAQQHKHDPEHWEPIPMEVEA